MNESLTLCSATLGEDGSNEPPLGPLYIASALEEMGVSVDFRDFQLFSNANGFSGETLATFLNDHSKLVAISCFVDMLPCVIDATYRLYKKNPDTIFLLGGPGPTAKASRIIEEYPWIHSVVRSEGEETVKDWVRLIREEISGSVLGLTYRSGNKVFQGNDRLRIKDIDSLTTPAYHLVDWDKYDGARIITTRGCSYRCSFCDVTALWNNISVFRDLNKVISEIELIRDASGKNQIGIVDDTFVLNRKRVIEFCQMLIKHNLGIQWGCFGRINLMDEDLIKLMAESGCTAIFYGIDSGSQRILDKTVKRVKVDDIIPVLKMSCEYFDHIEASFIWGYPFETLEDFQHTLDLAAEATNMAPRVNVQLHMLSPLPSSPIYINFDGELVEPDNKDTGWLLLPPLLLDKRSHALRDIIISNPDIYPGFYTFPTPNKHEKRELLERSLGKLHMLIGSTLFDEDISNLKHASNPDLEQELLHKECHPSDRIGVGLALGFFMRLRKQKSSSANVLLGNDRKAGFTRQRNDFFAKL